MDQTDPAISIIIPSFNGAKRVANILQAFGQQLGPNDELLVVDDASTDDTAAIAKRLGADVLTLADNSGVGEARNRGCFQAKNDLLVVFDDDVVPTEKFLTHVRRLFKDPEIQCYQGPHALEPFDKSSNIWQKADAIYWRHLMVDQYVQDGLCLMLYSGSFCIRKSFFIKVGGFSQSFSGAGAEEFELSNRIPKFAPMHYCKDLESHHDFKPFWSRVQTVFKRAKSYSSAIKMVSGPWARQILLEKIKVVLVYLAAISLPLSALFPEAMSYLLTMPLAVYFLMELPLLVNTNKWKGVHWIPAMFVMRIAHHLSIGAGVIVGLRNSFWDKIKFFFTDEPGYLIFWVTQNCNARCSHCFNWQENTKKNHDLKLDEIVQLAKNYGHLKYLTIAGGEPSLRRDLPDIVGAFVKHAGVQMCTIITNGYRWEPMLVQMEQICSRYHNIGLNVVVSIDAIGDAHDELRGLKGCYDGSMRLIAGIKELRKRFPNVMVAANGVYSSSNADTILETGRHMLTKVEVPFSLALVRGDVENQEMLAVDVDHFKQVATELINLQESIIPQTTIDSVFRFALEEISLDGSCNIRKTGEPFTRCQAGRQGLVLESNGKLRLCEGLPNDFGNIRDFNYSIPKMLTTPEGKKTIDFVWDTNCRCDWRCYISASIPFDKKLWPRLAYTAFKKLLSTSSNKSAVDKSL